mgnify:CR=1 FL=1
MVIGKFWRMAVRSFNMMAKKLVLRWLYDIHVLEFITWKSPTHYEQYTAVKFLGKEIHRITWSQLEKMDYQN